MKALIVLSFFLLIGCISEKKARSKAEQFYRDHPSELAQTCSENFPIHSQYIEGITIVKKDSIIQKGILLDCPEQKVKVRCPDSKTIYVTTVRVDTVVKENTAKVDLLSNQLNTANSLMLEANKLNLSLQTKIEESKKKSDKLLYILICLGSLFGVSVLLRLKNII